MITKEQLIFYLIIAVIILVILLRNSWKANSGLKHSKRSQSVKYGKAIENFIPFMDDYPYDYHNFRFLGNPIDGVQFNEDEVIFIEFKGGSSQMSQKQRNIRNLIQNRKVYWKEVRI